MGSKNWVLRQKKKVSYFNSEEFEELKNYIFNNNNKYGKEGYNLNNTALKNKKRPLFALLNINNVSNNGKIWDYKIGFRKSKTQK